MDFEKERQGYSLLEREDDRVAALEVADLEDTTVRVGRGDEMVGGFEGGRDGLLDEDIDSGFEKCHADIFVQSGGDGDDRGIHFARKLLYVGQAEAVFGDFGRGQLPGVGIDDGDQRGAWVLAAHTDVVFSELSGSGNGHTEARIRRRGQLLV
jgi:hypothetical protein